MTTELLTITAAEEAKVLSFINTNFANGTVTPIEGTASLFKIRGLLPLEQKSFAPNTRYKLIMPNSNLFLVYIPEYKLTNTVRPYTQEEIDAFKASKE